MVFGVRRFEQHSRTDASRRCTSAPPMRPVVSVLTPVSQHVRTVIIPRLQQRVSAAARYN